MSDKRYYVNYVADIYRGYMQMSGPGHLEMSGFLWCGIIARPGKTGGNDGRRAGGHERPRDRPPERDPTGPRAAPYPREGRRAARDLREAGGAAVRGVRAAGRRWAGLPQAWPSRQPEARRDR